jgi:hypothetical protein
MTEEYCSENTDDISSPNQVDLYTPESLHTEPVVTYNSINSVQAEVENQLASLAEFLSSVTDTTEKQGYIVDFIDSLQDVSILEQCLSNTANVEIISLFSSMPDYSIILLSNPNIREQQTMAILNTIMLNLKLSYL